MEVTILILGLPPIRLTAIDGEMVGDVVKKTGVNMAKYTLVGNLTIDSPLTQGMTSRLWPSKILYCGGSK